MSKPLKYYYDLMSQPGRAVYMFLKANNIPFEAHRISIAKGEHLTDDYKNNVNRFKKIPCIIDNDFKLAESIAIFRYLSREKSVADHWYPKDSRKQARVDEYLEWQHINTRTHCTRYFWYVWVYPLMGKPAPEKFITEAKKGMEDVLDLLENVWLTGEQNFIAGNEISVADLLAIAELDQTLLAGYDVTIGRPKLKVWITLVRQTLGPLYDEVMVPIRKIIAKQNISKL